MKRATKKSPKKKSASGRKHRASWTGNLTFGLVSFEVQAFNARNPEQGDIHFHQLHAPCHNRIHYSKVCPVHGEVSNDEIVSGYEYAKGKYVEIEGDELDELRTDDERALTIDTFVDPDTVDPLYFDGRMYYLLPGKAAGSEPYSVMAEAMQREEKYAVGTVVFSGKQQIALVRALENGLLHMAMLNYQKELRQPEEVAGDLKKPKKINRQVQLAQTLIRSWFDDKFDFSDYEDDYRDEVKKLIKAKVEGREIVRPEQDDEEPAVVNLMEALKRSAKEARAAKHKPTKRRRSG